MGSGSSKQEGGNTPETVKLLIENIYKDILSEQNINETITKTYCNDLKVFLANDALKKYSTEVLGKESKNLVLGIESTDNNTETHAKLCERLSDYYVKKINLVGTIINTISLLHHKLDRLNNGGVCYNSKNRLKDSNIKYGVNIKPSLPFKFKFDDKLILLETELEQMRNEIVKKSGLKGDLNKNLSLIEILDRDTCEANGGIWLSTKHQLEKVLLVPTEADKHLNGDWVKEYKKLETIVYKSITKLINTLNLLVEERVEPRMVNGSETRVKVYRDRLITMGELDKYILDTKNQIKTAFVSVDTQSLIINSHIDVKTRSDDKRLAELEKEVSSLKKKGKLRR
jgi:hypothetical protein